MYSSFQVGFLPYIKIPTLYIFEANQTTPKNVPNNNEMDRINCHIGTPKGIRISITIGDVSGTIENTVATVPNTATASDQRCSYRAAKTAIVAEYRR